MAKAKAKKLDTEIAEAADENSAYENRQVVTKPAAGTSVPCPFADLLGGAELIGEFSGGIQRLKHMAYVETAVGKMTLPMDLYASQMNGEVREFGTKREAYQWLRGNEKAVRFQKKCGKVHADLSKLAESAPDTIAKSAVKSAIEAFEVVMEYFEK